MRREMCGWYSVSPSKKEGWRCVSNGGRIYQNAPLISWALLPLPSASPKRMPMFPQSHQLTCKGQQGCCGMSYKSTPTSQQGFKATCKMSAECRGLPQSPSLSVSPPTLIQIHLCPEVRDAQGFHPPPAVSQHLDKDGEAGLGTPHFLPRGPPATKIIR